MPVDYSSTFRENTNAVTGTVPVLTLVEINHPDLTEPVFVVNDLNNLTSNGNTYIACAFNITLPSDPQTGLPTAQIQIDNVSQLLINWLEVSNGGAGATITLSQVLQTTPNTVEWSVTMNLTNIVVDNLHVTGQLQYLNLLQLSLTPYVYNPQLSPGLFAS